MKKWSRALAAELVYLAVFIAIYFVHVRFLRVDVVFYAALEDAACASLVVAALLFLVPAFSLFNAFEKVQLIAIVALTGYALAISIPTVLDRSLSFYILEKLDQRGGGIKYSAFESVFTQEYVKEHHLVDVRLTEQLKSGTIVIHDGCVSLTPRGRDLAQFSRWFRTNLLPRQRLLMGEYSDALTDPFRNSSSAAAADLCQ
jgi:hypothetical protein